MPLVMPVFIKITQALPPELTSGLQQVVSQCSKNNSGGFVSPVHAI